MTDIVAPTASDEMTADWAGAVAAGLNSVAAGRRPMAAGKVSVKLTQKVSETLGTYYRGHGTVHFPDGLFSAGPVVVLRPNSSYPGIMLEATFTGISRLGMTVYVARADKTTTVINWIAVAADSASDSGTQD
jgi:hypothetical protein